MTSVLRLLLAAALLAACRIHPIETGASSWKQLESAHFVFVTDLDDKRARARVERLEQSWTALALAYQLIAPRRAPPGGKLRVIWLAECRDLQGQDPRIRGFVGSSVIRRGTRFAGLCELGSEHRYRTLVHELAHRFNAHYFAGIPTWLNEGLASFFQTIEIEGGHVVIGRQTRDRAYYSAPPIKASRLAAMSWKAFRAIPDRRGYYSAWALVHLLSNPADGHLEPFRRYLAAIAGGAGSNLAWKTHLSSVEDELDRALSGYHKRWSYAAWKLSATLPGYRGPIASRSLSAAEAATARMEIAIHAFGKSAIKRQLAAEADAIDGWPERHFWRGYLSFMPVDNVLFDPDDLPIKRVEPFEAWVREAPDSADAQAWLLRAEIDRHRRGGPEPRMATVQKVAGLATRPDQMVVVAHYFLDRRMPKQALPWIQRGLTADRECIECLEARARAIFQLGNPALAARIQAFVNGTYSDSLLSKARVALLERYRAAARDRSRER